MLRVKDHVRRSLDVDRTSGYSPERGGERKGHSGLDCGMKFNVEGGVGGSGGDE